MHIKQKLENNIKNDLLLFITLLMFWVCFDLITSKTRSETELPEKHIASSNDGCFVMGVVNPTQNSSDRVYVHLSQISCAKNGVVLSNTLLNSNKNS